MPSAASTAVVGALAPQRCVIARTGLPLVGCPIRRLEAFKTKCRLRRRLGLTDAAGLTSLTLALGCPTWCHYRRTVFVVGTIQY